MATLSESNIAVKKRESLADADDITETKGKYDLIRSTTGTDEIAHVSIGPVPIPSHNVDLAEEKGAVLQIVSIFEREPISMDHSGIATEKTIVV